MNLSCKIKLLWNRSFLVADKNARFGKEKNGVVRRYFKQKTKIPIIKYRYASKYVLTVNVASVKRLPAKTTFFLLMEHFFITL